MKTFAILLGLCALLAVAYAQQEEVVATVGPNGDFATVCTFFYFLFLFILYYFVVLFYYFIILLFYNYYIIVL